MEISVNPIGKLETIYPEFQITTDGSFLIAKNKTNKRAKKCQEQYDTASNLLDGIDVNDVSAKYKNYKNKRIKLEKTISYIEKTTKIEELKKIVTDLEIKSGFKHFNLDGSTYKSNDIYNADDIINYILNRMGGKKDQEKITAIKSELIEFIQSELKRGYKENKKNRIKDAIKFLETYCQSNDEIGKEIPILKEKARDQGVYSLTSASQSVPLNKAYFLNKKLQPKEPQVNLPIFLNAVGQVIEKRFDTATGVIIIMPTILFKKINGVNYINTDKSIQL